MDTNSEQSEIKFIIPDESNYDCQMCGKCCLDFWDIPIDDESYEQLNKVHWSEYDKRFDRITPFIEVDKKDQKQSLGDEGYQYSFQMINNKCCFLASNNQCLIHTHLGHNIKSQICKEFPFRFIDTPRGVYLGLSFACSSIIENRGRSLKEQEESLRNIYQKRFYKSSLSEEISLNNKFDINWDIYLEIEKAIFEILDRDFLSIEKRLIAVQVFLNMITMALDKIVQKSEDFKTDLIPSIIESFRKQNYNLIFSVLSKMKGSQLVQRMILGILISFRSGTAVKRNRFGTLYFLLKCYLKHSFKLGVINIYPINLKIKYSKLKDIKYPTDDSFFNYVLTRYLKHLMFRKELLAHRDVIEGFNILLLYFALIKWYAIALAASENAREVSRQNLLNAISLVERYYVFHTNFKQIFTYTPVLSHTFENIFNKKIYAPTITMHIG